MSAIPRRLLAAVLIVSTWSGLAARAGEEGKQPVEQALEDRFAEDAALAGRIWGYAEVGYQETRSSAALQQALAEAGFAVESGVAGMPTAFVARHDNGRPVVALLAEFDALPGISQDAVPERRPLAAPAGHACGHHLLGAAAVAAGIVVRDRLRESGTQGSIRVFGTPAEEGGAGKVYLARAGLFDDVDVVLHWHPGDRNSAAPLTTLANKSAKFRFRGISAHAAQAPERGRSALDGVEAMNFMANLMREHVPETTRLHYVITAGGKAPNVVPDFAEVFYYVRHPDAATVESIFDRLLDVAAGAARGTGTTVEHEVIHGARNVLPNETLARVLDANLRAVGGPRWDADDLAFARTLWATLDAPALALGSETQVQAFEPGIEKGSTDVGDISWQVPTAGITAATWVPGTPAHSWQAIAAGGTAIGAKGMLVAAKTLARTALDVYADPGLVAAARAELERRRGPGFVYRSLVGDREPPLDYRD